MVGAMLLLAPLLVALRGAPGHDLPFGAARSTGAAVAPLPGGGLRIVQRVGGGTPIVVHVPAANASWDLSGAAAVWFSVTNTGAQPAAVFATMDGSLWSDTAAVVPAGGTQTVVVPLMRYRLPAALAPRFPAMNGAPGGAMSLWTGAGGGTGSLALAAVAELTLTVGAPPRAGRTSPPQPIELRGLRWVPWDRAVGTAASPLSDAVYPFVDRYGQSGLSDWPGKVRADGDFARHGAVEAADLSRHPSPPRWSRFGAWRYPWASLPLSAGIHLNELKNSYDRMYL
jgi:hypothetical protein